METLMVAGSFLKIEPSCLVLCTVADEVFAFVVGGLAHE